MNQRFEVYFAEKRPFFLDNANYFQTPENLFFSRRIVNPEYGARLTGRAGSWLAGLLGSMTGLRGSNWLQETRHGETCGDRRGTRAT